MKPRKAPNNQQILRRMQRELIGPHDPRARNDAYWALRHQGYPDAFARRAFRDMLPRFYREKVELSGEYINRHSPYDRCRSPRLGDFGLPSNTGRRPRRKRRSA